MSVTGQLRDAYDGYSCRAVGTGVKGFHSKFGVIAAVTNIIDKHRGLLAELGERFLTFRCAEVDDEESTERCWRVSDTRSVIRQEAELRAAAQKVLDVKPHKVILSDTFRKKVIQVAQYVAIARCEIEHDKYTGESDIPMPEVATRLTKQLCDLATGISIVRGERYVSRSTQRLVQKTALDCLSLKRLCLIKTLYDAFPNGLSSKQIADKLRYSESGIRGWCADLYLLNLLKKEYLPNTKAGVGERLIWKTCYNTVLNQIWG
jgi:hypothetical protein